MKQAAPTQPTYQQLQDQLNQVLAALQDPNTGIDQAVQLHQQGTKLLHELTKFLESAENTIAKQSA